MMRKSSSGGRASLVPLRIRNEGNNGKQSMGMGSLGNSRRSSISSRSSFGSRNSFGSHGTVMGKGRPTFESAKKRHMSVGGGMRSSVGGNMRSTTTRKDPRPVSDKGYQQKCIKYVIELLVNLGYPNNISTKIMMSPSMKDFIRIFEFIYGHLVKNFKIQKKPEEEIPRILKQLDYPFTISKTYMYAIGTPHTWPNILVALRWLCELIQFGMSVSSNIADIIFPTEFDTINVPESYILFDYYEKTYEAFLDGADTYESYDEALSHTLKSKYYGGSDNSITHLQEENGRLASEIELVGENPDQLKHLQGIEHGSMLDEKRFQGYLEDLAAHKDRLEQSLGELEEELISLGTEFDAENQKNEDMQRIFDNQPFSQSDIERIKFERAELKRQIDELENRCEGVEQETWSSEIAISKEHEEFEAICTEYNNLATDLKLIPSTAENAFGIDYELKPSHSMYNGYMSNQFTDVIKPALMKVKKQCTESKLRKETEKMELQNSLEQVSEHVSDLKEEINMSESQYKRMDEEVEFKKQLYQKEFQQKQENLKTLQNELLEIKTLSQLGDQDSAKDLREVNRWAEQKLMDMKQGEEKYRNFLINVIGETCDHKEAIQKQLQVLCQESDEMLKKQKLMMQMS